MFCSKPSSALNLPIYLVEITWQWTLDCPGHAWVLLKNEAVGVLFWKRSMLPPRIFLTLQLSCFDFHQIRPLKASKLRFQILPCFGPKLAVFGFVGSYAKLRTHYLKRLKPWAYDKHAAHLLMFSLPYISCIPYYLHINPNGKCYHC